ncbi:MAG TPA: phosphotransferase, partial [Acidimicrobiales bacterium]|nr:phosphotransferase [Acidimicrobiales bacterium]
KLRILHMEPQRLDLPRFHRGGGTWLDCCQQSLVEEIRWGNSAGFLSDGAAESLRESGLASLDLDEEPRLTFIHGDLQPDQVLLRRPEGRVAAFLDFGDAGAGDPAWDLVVLSIHDPDRLAILLDGYRAIAKFAEHVEQVRLAYRLLRHLSVASRLAEHELDPQPEVQMALRLS